MTQATPSLDMVEAALARAAREPQWLSQACGLASEVLAPMLAYYLPLAQHIADRRAARGNALVVGIQGPQGAGKSTLAIVLQRVLNEIGGLRVACLSIDDLYLTRAEREQLAARVHPLFITRGVPGTHDVALGECVLASLLRPGPTAIPRFDKAQDDRLPERDWPVVDGPCDVVLFEGLWIGVPALNPDLLSVPINTFEAREDPQALWRRHANRELAESYPSLFARCQLLVHVQVPDFSCVRRWRTQAERALRARVEAAAADTSRIMDDAALARFFDHYERFTLHAMACMPALADVVLQMDREHRVVLNSLLAS